MGAGGTKFIKTMVSPFYKRICSAAYESSNVLLFTANLFRVCHNILQNHISISKKNKNACIFSLRVAVCFILFLVTNYIEEGQFLEKKNHALG